MSSGPFNHWLVRWQLTPDGAAFTTRAGSQLLPVVWRGERAILKIAAHEEERRGGKLMEWYGGTGAAGVLAAIALHAPRDQVIPTGLVPLEIWFRALETAASQHGGTFATCAGVARSLFADQREPVVLHGDFHHDNVLDGGARGWLVIDPKGLVGERAFEYANLFRNPDLATALAPGRMRRRIQIAAREADLDDRRLLDWVVAYAGLGAAWSLEDGDDPGPGLAIAEHAMREGG